MRRLDRMLRIEMIHRESTSRAGPGQKRRTGMTPRSTKRDQTIPLGIVGGGSVWETRFRAAISSTTRCKVVAVYSPLPCEARSVAEQTASQVYFSLRRMLARSGVKALLVLESGWGRDWAISMAISQQIPVLVASPIDSDLPRVASELVTPEAEGAMVVPGTLLRATPAALRLRELVATKLGPILEMKIDLPAREMQDAQVISVIDWCRWLLGGQVSQIERPSATDGPRLIMSCGRRASNSAPVRTEICGHATSDQTVATVRCRQGDAELTGESCIRWRTELETADESLVADRPAEQVLLDLFLRRVVGGVVPVPSWADLQAACQLWMNTH